MLDENPTRHLLARTIVTKPKDLPAERGNHDRICNFQRSNTEL